MIADAKKQETSFNSIKEYYIKLRNSLAYDSFVFFIEKYAFNEEFKKKVLSCLSLCKDNENYEVVKNSFIGKYSDIDDSYDFTLSIKFPVITFRLKNFKVDYQGSLTYSYFGNSYVCYKRVDTTKYKDSNDRIKTIGYDTYDVITYKEVLIFDYSKKQTGKYSENISENFVVNRETNEKTLTKPNIHENYVNREFSYIQDGYLLVRETKEYTHPNKKASLIPLENIDVRFRGKATDIYLWGISKETAEELNFPSDEEIKQYQKLMIS